LVGGSAVSGHAGLVDSFDVDFGVTFLEIFVKKHSAKGFGFISSVGEDSALIFGDLGRGVLGTSTDLPRLSEIDWRGFHVAFWSGEIVIFLVIKNTANTSGA
jgi:hypothetical protein